MKFLIIIYRKTHMFGVEGQHTFFIPVDSAFDVSRFVGGYDFERTRLRNDGSSSRGVLHNRGGTVRERQPIGVEQGPAAAAIVPPALKTHV